MLFMSLKLIRRRMLPPTLLKGLLFACPAPLLTPSSFLSRSVLGFVIGGAFCTGAPALKLRSSRKYSLSFANFMSAWSKSKSPSVPPPLPVVVGALIVTLLLLLWVFSSSSSPWIEVRTSLDSLLSLFHELFLECRAVARGVPLGGDTGVSPSLPSSIVVSTCGEEGPAPLLFSQGLGGEKTWSLYERESMPAIQK